MCGSVVDVASRLVDHGQLVDGKSAWIRGVVLRTQEVDPPLGPHTPRLTITVAFKRHRPLTSWYSRTPYLL
jgi:hypothetical protein